MNSIVPLVQLFDRPIGPNHAWYAGFQAMQNSGNTTMQAVYANLAMEHRIPSSTIKNLETDVAQCFQNQISVGVSPDLSSALSAYFSDCHLQPPSKVRFLGQPVHKLPPKTQLIHTTSMTKLFRRLFKTEPLAGKLMDIFGSYLGDTKELPESSGGWESQHTLALANSLNALDHESFVEFMEGVHSLLPNNAPCWWAAPYLDLKKQTQELEIAENIALALGMGHFENDDFLLVYQYSPNEAGQLYVPTTPETNADHFHFPSPPQTTALGGLSMPLTNNLVSCSEFIHHPLNAENASRALRQPIRSLANIIGTSALVQNLPQLRQHHRQVLRTQHGSSIAGQQWVQKYVHLV